MLTCFALTWVNFFAAGPGSILVEIVIDLFGVYPPNPKNPATLAPKSIAAFLSAVSKVALLMSTTTLAAGMSNLIWVPLAVKYGRRMVYTSSFLAFGLCCIWSARASTYGSLLASRIIASWFSGSTECVAPITIADIFFLHERGKMTAYVQPHPPPSRNAPILITAFRMYSAALSTGAALGLMVSAVMSISTSWRAFHYLCAGLVLTTTLLIFFTMPETAYQRTVEREEEETDEKVANVSEMERAEVPTAHKKTFIQRMAFNRSSLTHEPIWKIIIRPALVLFLPPVLWSTVSFGIGIGIFVIMGTTAATAFTEVYQFTTWQVGVVWIAGIVGNFLGIPFGGYFSDWVANRATTKNGGVREPEMRLPAVSIAMITYPAALLLYGLGINYKAHYMVPVLGVFLCKNFCSVYFDGSLLTLEL